MVLSVLPIKTNAAMNCYAKMVAMMSAVRKEKQDSSKISVAQFQMLESLLMEFMSVKTHASLRTHAHLALSMEVIALCILAAMLLKNAVKTKDWNTAQATT